MKTLQKLLLLFLLNLTTALIHAQPNGHWKVVGNPATGIDGVAAGSNFLGTDGTNNVPLQLGTFGIPRMFIQNNTGPTAGFVGVNTAAPNQLLTINGGNINAETSTTGYMINNRFVLLTKGNTANIFGGVDAGISNTTGFFNAFYGFQAGYSNSSGVNNTFIGSSTGVSNISGGGNTFIGEDVGAMNIAGNLNTFMGQDAGFFNNGNDNSFVGAEAGFNNSSGNLNVSIGKNAGNSNVTGNNNTCLGANAFAVGINAANLSNTTALGTNAQVTTDNTMILGSNTIGLALGFPGRPVDH
jgi:trimeric autotransporter adhesin